AWFVKHRTLVAWFSCASAAALVWLYFAFVSPKSQTPDAHQQPVVVSVQDLWDRLDREGQAQFNEGQYQAAGAKLSDAVKAAGDLAKPAILELSLKKLAVLFHVSGRSAEEKDVDRRLAELQPRLPAPENGRKLASEEHNVVQKLWSMLPNNTS